ncbi:MAG: glycosyltransferase family 39 protein [Chloroflexi bacterium]|nr:glycosyltransferase family 39 protein [Chloroflexota bacterium]
MIFKRYSPAFFLPLAVLLLAAGLYIIGTNRVSFWEDESWMASAVRGDLPHVWTFATERGVHPPLYFLLGWLYTRFAGDSEIALRWLAGLCAVLGVAFTYRLGADWYGRRAGLYAALLAAGSLFLIYFGRLARHYTLFFALAAALVWAYERWVNSYPLPVPRTHGKGEREPQPAFLPLSVYREGVRGRGWLLTITLLHAALLYTHYFGVWMAAVLGLHGLLTLRQRDFLWLCTALALGGLLFLPWLPSLLDQLHRGGGGLGYATRGADYAIRAYLDRTFNGDYLLGFTLAVLGVAATWRWRRFRAGLLLLLWLTVPLALSLLLNARFTWFIERNMIFTLAGAYVLLGAGLAWISRYSVGRWVAPVAALVFVTLGLVQYPVYWPFVTADWRSLGGAMAAYTRPDDTIVIRGEIYSLDYYLRRYLGQSPRYLRFDDWLAHDTPAPARLWLVDGEWAVRDEAKAVLPPDAVQTRQIVLGPLVAEMYQRAPAEPLVTFGGQIALGDSGLPQIIEAAPGATLNLDLWWRAVRPPDADYSVGVYLVAPDGRVLAQQDGGFDQGRVPALLLPADRWTPDARALTLPAVLPAGDYPLTVTVYDWQTGERLPPDADARDDDAYPLAVVRVG